MKKDLLIGLAVGFGLAFAWNKMKGKDCGCGDEVIEAEEADIKKKNDTDGTKMTCEQAVTKIMSTMRFSSQEAMEAFRASEMKKCMNTK